MNLLLIYDEEHIKSHYIYIKHDERLLNICTTSFYKNTNFCPYCNKIVNNDIPFEEHLFKTHYDTKKNCNISLPKEGDKMAFLNYKNLLERPFIVYADFESSLIPTEDLKKIHIHKANSACCYFVCTFDSSRNKLYNFIGDNCVIDLLDTLTKLAKSCIEEMRKIQILKCLKIKKMIIDIANNVIYVKVNLQNQIIKLETTVIEQVNIEERHIQDAILIILIIDIFQ
jgi:hypothetical protein